MQAVLPYKSQTRDISAMGTCIPDACMTNIKGMPGGSSTFARRQLGRRLKQIRTDRKLKVVAVAAAVGTVDTTVRRWESGDTGLSQMALIALCGLYEVPTDERAVLTALREQGQMPDWWAPYDLPPDYQRFIGLESAATEQTGYEPQFVPGLLQTADYTRGLVMASMPDATDEQVEARVEARLRRQERIIGDDPLTLRAVIDESVLARPVGGQAVLAAQLDRLSELAELPHVEVRVCPYSAIAGVAGSFALLTLPDERVVYVESLTGDLYAQGAAVERYRVVHRHLWTAAASAEASLGLIRRAARAVARA